MTPRRPPNENLTNCGPRADPLGADPGQDADNAKVPRRIKKSVGGIQVRLNRQKKVLVTMLCLGTLLSVAGAGTLASFTAQTTNPGNTFTNGSVTMTNVAGS